MKYWSGVLRFALYLVVLSSILVPLSHSSWTQFAGNFLIRLAFVVPFAAITFRILRSETVEPYRITKIPAEAIDDPEGSREKLPAAPAMTQLQVSPKKSRSFLIVLVLILTIFWLTQTSWWSHQAWIDKMLETAIRWAICLFCWGFIVLLWLPKPDAGQPERYLIVPPDSSLRSPVA